MTSKLLTISAALVLLGGAPAAAQTNGWFGTPAYGGDDYRAPYQDARRAAHDNGYRDGLKRGEQAARDGKAFNERIERDYRDADNGYNRTYGDRGRYRDDYRGGFAQGYRDGYYRRDPRNGNNRGYGNRGGNYGNGYGYGRNAGYGAFQNGAGDGYRKGLEDIQKRRYPDVTRHSWYRSGDHDYDRAYGSRDAYKIEYRRGFEQGYNRAFREGRRW